MRLVIDKVALNDSGVWRCRMTTEHGSVETLSLDVVVMDTTVLRCPQHTVHTSKGKVGEIKKELRL